MGKVVSEFRAASCFHWLREDLCWVTDFSERQGSGKKGSALSGGQSTAVESQKEVRCREILTEYCDHRFQSSMYIIPFLVKC